jgi:hypothetical protein
MKMRLLTLSAGFILFIFLLTYSKAESLRSSTNGEVYQFFDISDTMKVSGKTLYEQKCGQCHPLFSPKDFTFDKWKQTLVVMRERAQLTNSQYNSIVSYLKANAKK